MSVPRDRDPGEQRTILDLYRFDLEHPRELHTRYDSSAGTVTHSTAQLEEQAAAVADALVALGVGRGDRVVMLCDNRPEWHVIDLAVLALGAVVVPVYNTLTVDQLAYQARDCGATVAVAETEAYASRLLEVQASCPCLENLVQIDGEITSGLFRLSDFTRRPAPNAVRRLWQRAAAVAEHDLATIVYTSGTTGEPKGVMLSHRNIVTNAVEILDRARVVTGPGDVALEFLPLCHMIERIAGYCYMRRRVTRVYCSVNEVSELIGTIAPTVFASVPRVLEKVHAAMLHRARSASPLRRALFRWAVRVGHQADRRARSGAPSGAALRLGHAIADRLVLARIRGAFGGRLRGTFCGGAPLPVEVNEFLRAAGIPVLEAYGLTETSPVLTINGSEPGELRVGSVGRPLPSFTVVLAADGELLARGPSVTNGYWGKAQSTDEAFDNDGFFHTGDIATIDDDGFVFITDRKKDLIVTAGGKNIAPQPIENRLKVSPYVETAVLIGDGRPYVVALLAPAEQALLTWAEEHGLDGTDLATVVTHRETTALYDRELEEVNRDLARFEQIKRFVLLDRPLTVEAGHLTPTLKVKRRAVTAEFSREIEAMYGARTPG